MATGKTVGRMQLRTVGGIPGATRAQGGTCKVAAQSKKVLLLEKIGCGSKACTAAPSRSPRLHDLACLELTFTKRTG
jgi:hypothetical protein